MPNYHYPNLTIINETDFHSKNSNVFDNAVIASLPLLDTDAIGHQSIRDAIQQQFQLDMQVEDVSKLCFLHCTWIYQDYHACHHYMLLSPPWSKKQSGIVYSRAQGCRHPLVRTGNRTSFRCHHWRSTTIGPAGSADGRQPIRPVSLTSAGAIVDASTGDLIPHPSRPFADNFYILIIFI